MKYFLLFATAFSITIFGNAQWNSNTSVNLQVSSLPMSDMQSLTTSTGRTWIAFYHENNGNYDMRAQLLDVDGTKLLGADGMLVDNKPSGTATFVFNICKDADDNLIVAYQDQRSGQLAAVAYKVSQTGTHLWSSSGVVIGPGLAPYPAVLSTGETVVAWIESTTNTLQIQKIATNGTLAWSTPVSVLVGTSLTTRGQLVPNLNGAFTMIFQRRGFGISTTLYAQRYTSSGSAVWSAPVQLSTETTSGARYYSVAGEADITYCGYYSAQGSRFNSWLHRINPDGTLPYGGNGSNFSTATSSSDPYQQMTNIALNPGSLYVWSVCSYSNTSQSQYGVYVQKFLKETGARLLSNTAQNIYPISAALDTHAGNVSLVDDAPMFMSYDANYKIYVTRLDGNGAFVWSGNRIEISSTTAALGSPKGRFNFTGLSNNQAVGVWAETRNGIQNAYAQNISPGSTTSPGFSFNNPGAATAVCPAPSSMSIQLNTIAAGGFAGAIALTASGQPAGTSVSFSANPVTVGNSTTVTLSGTNLLSAGSYTISIQGTGTGVPSQTASLTYTISNPPAIVITAQPQAQTICAGATTSFAVTATGTGITYQWEQSANGCSGPWSAISGATSATYSITNAGINSNNTAYRCVVSAPCTSSVTSGCALLNVIAPATITTQPISQIVCERTSVSFTIAGSGSNLVYQWQVNTGPGFTNLVNNASFSGVTTSTLTIPSALVNYSGYQFRCLVSNTICTTPVTSSVVTLTVNAYPLVSAQPPSPVICLGTDAFFSVVATGSALQYQWQVNTGNGFVNLPNAAPNSGVNTEQLTVASPTVSMSGYQYRCVVSGACAPAATSNVGTLTVHAPVVINRPLTSQEVCTGSAASFIITASSVAPISYQWQQSTNGGATWTILPVGQSTLQLVAVPLTLNGNRYRCIVSNSTCTATATSNSALLTVRAVPTVGLTATPVISLLPGQTTTLTATPSASTGGTISTNWTQNSQPYTPSSNLSNVAAINDLGTYQVGIRETWPSGLFCSALSQTVTITASVSNRLFIFPSPNDGNFTVSYYYSGSSASARVINIYDGKGALVYRESFSVAGPYTLLPIDLRNAARGIYYVVVGDASGNKLIQGKVHIR
jgi:hypothetical protein